MGPLKTKVGQELYALDTRNVIPAKAGIQEDLRTAICCGVLTYICYFLFCTASFVLPVMAEDTTFVPLKDWREYTREEREFLRDRWTDEKTEAVIAALKHNAPLPNFIDSLYDSTEILDIRMSLYRPDLRGINFNNKDISGVYLNGACLQGADLASCRLDSTELVMTDLQGASLTGANLQRAKLSGANLQGAYLRYADLQGAYLRYAVFKNTILYRPCLDSTVSYRDIEWRNCYVGDDLVTYRQLKSLYRNVRMDELIARFHYWENWSKTRQASFPNRIVRLFFLELTYGYGSRPWRLLWYSLSVIGLFTVVFYVLSLFPRVRAGIYMTKQGETRKKRLTWKHPHECLYASLLAFATVGYGALRPKQWLQLFRMKPVEHEPAGWIRIFVGLEAALGIWVLALLVTVLFGR